MAKPYTHTESADIKVLKSLFFCGICGAQVKRRVKTSGEERWYCPSDAKHISVALTDKVLLVNIGKLQNYLAANQHLVKDQQNTLNQIDIRMVRMQNQIDLALNQQGADLVGIQQSIMEFAAQKYKLLQDTHCDGKELKAKIAQLSGPQLDSRLIKEITAQIQLTHTATTALVLRNGQLIPLPTAEKGASHHE